MKKDKCFTGTSSDAALAKYQEEKEFHWAVTSAEFYMDIIMINHARGLISARKCRDACKQIAYALPGFKENFAAYYRVRVRRWLGAFPK